MVTYGNMDSVSCFRFWFRNAKSGPASHLPVSTEHFPARLFLHLSGATVQATLRAHQERQVSGLAGTHKFKKSLKHGRKV